MKNKLEKTGHKRIYYRMRGAFHVFLFSLIGLSLLAVPVGITYHIAETKAQTIERSSSDSGLEDSQKSDSSLSSDNSTVKVDISRF